MSSSASGRRSKRPTGRSSSRSTVASSLAAAGSLEEAVAAAELVVVAVPVGSLVGAARAALEAAGPDTTVTDVGSTKRALAREIDDPRFVPGHPLAGGATGGPARAAADLFDGATWFLTPTPATDSAGVDLLERFVASLRACSLRLDAETHER